MPSSRVAVFVGSLRKESYNMKMAKVILSLAPPSLAFEIIEIGHLPLYNQDLDDEGRPPESWKSFREHLKNFDGVLFVTPEYNRSIPGVLKNALDVGSRPYGQSVWDGKPTAVISVSPGAIGGFGANHHLRQCLVFLNMPPLQQPEAYIGGAAKLFKGDGSLAQDDTREFLHKFVTALESWVVRNKKEVQPR